MNTITYIVVNKDLKMSAGKAMAQVAHAVLLTMEEDDLQLYRSGVQRTVIVLEGTESQIDNLWGYLDARDIRCDSVIDEGANEIPTMSTTALAVQPFDIDDDEKRGMFKGFKLYKHGRFHR